MVDSRNQHRQNSNVETVTALMRMKAKLVACRAGTSLNVSNNVSKPILVMRRLKPMRQA